MKRTINLISALCVVLCFLLVLLAVLLGSAKAQDFKATPKFDRKINTLIVGITAATILDGESTQYCLRHNGVETNPFLGSHPGRLRYYSTAFAEDAGYMYASYWLRKHHKKYWMLPALVKIGTHSFFGSRNIRRTNAYVNWVEKGIRP